MIPEQDFPPAARRSPARVFYQEWVIVLLLLALTAALRFWRLGDAPPGLYRDEAYNGLDALRVLAGQRELYFSANNGREPLMIYLISLAVGLFGHTAWAVRLPAAVIGTLAVIPTYGLARIWFGRRVALFSGLLWAFSVWPLHLGRIGLRAGLLPPLLALTLWLATAAARAEGRRRATGAAAAGGAVYGLAFYSYLAVQLTPLAWLSVLVYLWWRGRLPARRVLLAFGAAALLVVLPLALYFAANPALLAGRTGQVSIFSPAISGGDPLGLLLRQIAAALGMFVWRGDTIGRHNIPARPVFDALLALPFLVGVGLAMFRARRQPAAAVLLLFPAVLLAGTVLAEDAPHFLRAVGVLPFILIFPALGLSALWSWSTLPAVLRQSAVVLLLAGSAVWTINSYFADYAQRTHTAYLFDAAARTLAEQAQADADSGAAVWLDRRYAEGWPSVPFLLTADVWLFDPALDPPTAPDAADVMYVWPYGPRDFVPAALPPDRPVLIWPGDWARGDLEPEPFLLTVRYQSVGRDLASAFAPPEANFDNQIWLQQIMLPTSTQTGAGSSHLTVDLLWRAPAVDQQALTAFVHVIRRADGALIGQLDAEPGGGHWAQSWWRPEQPFGERRRIALPEPYDPARHALLIGVYRAADLARLPLLAADGTATGRDYWELLPPTDRP